jgi:hypothetical protein
MVFLCYFLVQKWYAKGRLQVESFALRKIFCYFFWEVKSASEAQQTFNITLYFLITSKNIINDDNNDDDDDVENGCLKDVKRIEKSTGSRLHGVVCEK